MICEWKDGRMPARTERYLPERMNSFIQAGVRAGKDGILEEWNHSVSLPCEMLLCSSGFITIS